MVTKPEISQEVIKYARNGVNDLTNKFSNFSQSYSTVQVGGYDFGLGTSVQGEYTFILDTTTTNTLTVTTTNTKNNLQTARCIASLKTGDFTVTTGGLVKAITQPTDTKSVVYEIRIPLGLAVEIIGGIWAVKKWSGVPIPTCDARTIALHKISSMKIEQLTSKNSDNTVKRGTHTVQATSLATFTPSITPAGAMSATPSSYGVSCYFTGSMSGADAVFDGTSRYKFRSGLIYSYVNSGTASDFSPDNGTQRFYSNVSLSGDKILFTTFNGMNFGISQYGNTYSAIAHCANTVEDTIIDRWAYGADGTYPAINIVAWAEHGSSTYNGMTAEEVANISFASKYVQFAGGYASDNRNGSACGDSAVYFSSSTSRWDSIPPISGSSSVNYTQYCMDCGNSICYLIINTDGTEKLVGLESHTKITSSSGHYVDDFTFNTAIIPDSSKCVAHVLHSPSGGSGRYINENSSKMSVATGSLGYFGSDYSYGSSYLSLKDYVCIIFQNHDTLGNLLP